MESNFIIFDMYGSWVDYINDFKALCFPNPKELTKMRFSLSEEEIQSFWDGCSLAEMESLFTICHPYILQFVHSQLLPRFLTSRKTLYQAYTAGTPHLKQERTLFYVYDCKIFKSSGYSKEENDFFSSLLLMYRAEGSISQPVFQVVDPNSLAEGQWILKVKESCLLRVFTYLKDTLRKMRNRNDKIILHYQSYDMFMQEWMKFYYNYNIQITLGYFFRGLAILLQNQILLGKLSTLSHEQKEQRKYLRPIKLIDKPRNVQQFTLTEGNTETQTNWQSLKITAYRLKYRIMENNVKIECYLVPQENDWDLEVEDLTSEDQNILQAFKMLKKEEQYRSSGC